MTKSKKALSVFSLVMINIIAVDSLRSLPYGAVYGWGIIFFYLLAAAIFLLPAAFTTAELATGWPNRGGIYVWTREAFGPSAGFMVIWVQWIYNIVWYPTILTFITDTLLYKINPALADNKTFVLLIVIALFWLCTIVNFFGMKASSWVSTIGAMVGTIIPMVVIIVLAAIWLLKGHPAAAQLSWQTAIPSLTHFDNLVFLTVVLFGLIGLEMSAVHADEVDNPTRDYPRALLYSSGFIVVSLILASLAIALVVPPNQINIVYGLMQSFSAFFTAFHMNWAVDVIIAMIILGGFSGVATWIIGPTKGILVASQDGSLPKFFARTNRYGVPVNILLFQGVIFMLLCGIYESLPSVSASYFVLTDMSAQLSLVVYIAMFAAVIRLHHTQRKTDRAFKIPGGTVGVWCIAGLGILVSLAVIALGFLPPAQVKVGSTMRYEMILVGGMFIVCLLPLVIARGNWGKAGV